MSLRDILVRLAVRKRWSRPKANMEPMDVIFMRREIQENGCWVWPGTLDISGYGLIRHKGKSLRVHRITYASLVGQIPDGLELDHLCRVRACCNPLHLEPVTHAENCLRGESPTALHSKATHCRQGHPYDAENTYRRGPNGRWRHCKACRAERIKAWNLKKSLARKAAKSIEQPHG